MELELLDGRKIFVIHDFLDADECARFIELGEKAGFVDAPITTMGGFAMRKDVRDNARVIHDDVDLAVNWWQRARELIPDDWFGWKSVGMNERFRFYRYDVGQRFRPHFDGAYQRDSGEVSQFTFMVYLNGDFEGGGTAFRAGRAVLHVQPERGKALVFYHRQLHEGLPVEKGRKYVLRTDVMYSYEG